MPCPECCALRAAVPIRDKEVVKESQEPRMPAFSAVGSCLAVSLARKFWTPCLKSNTTSTLWSKSRSLPNPHPPVTQTSRGQARLHSGQWLARDSWSPTGPKVLRGGDGATAEQGCRNGPPLYRQVSTELSCFFLYVLPSLCTLISIG